MKIMYEYKHMDSKASILVLEISSLYDAQCTSDNMIIFLAAWSAYHKIHAWNRKWEAHHLEYLNKPCGVEVMQVKSCL